MRKKLFISSILCLLSLSVFAQNTCNTTTDAGNPNGITDNFSGSQGPSGVYYWGNNSEEEPTSFSFERNTNSGTLDITVNHLEGGLWSPMGMDINFGENEENPYLNGKDGEISTSITNPGDQAIEIYFTALSNGKTGDDAQTVTASSDGETVTLWGGVIPAGETANWTFDLSTAVKRTWVANQEACDDLNGQLVGNNNCITNAGFDVENISGLEFSINGAASVETSWANSLLENYDLNVNYLVVGECTDFNKTIGASSPEISDVSVDEETNTFTLSVSPVKDVEVILAAFVAKGPNDEEIAYLITEDPTTIDDDTAAEFDQVIKGTFNESEVSFVLDPSGLAEGEWTFTYAVLDENDNESDDFEYIFKNEADVNPATINNVTVESETTLVGNTSAVFDIDFTKGDREVVALLSEILGPNGEELLIMVVEDRNNLPFDLDEEDLEDFDEIIEGNFESSNISFDLDTDDFESGSWEMVFLVIDSEENQSDDFEYSLEIKAVNPPILNKVTVENETTFTGDVSTIFDINFTQQDNEVVLLLSEILGPNDESLNIMVVKDTNNLPFDIEDEDLEELEIDQVIEGNFEDSNISFNLDTDGFENGSWEMAFEALDNAENESNVIFYSFDVDDEDILEGCNRSTDAGNPNGITDNFLSNEGPSGVYYWGNSTDEVTTSFSFERNIEDGGSLDINVNHLENGLWAPMGLSIDFGNENDGHVYLNGENGEISTVISNPGDQAIEVYFTVTSNGTTGPSSEYATASRNGDNITLWGGIIPAEETVNWTFDLSTAVKRTWVADQEACDKLGGELVGGNNCITDAGFDAKHISDVEFSINGAASAETSWQNAPLENYDVEIAHLVIGQCTEFNKTIGASSPEISDVSVNEETNTFTLGFVPVEDLEVVSATIVAEGPNDEEISFLVVEDPTEVDDETAAEFDQVIKGTFNESEISFVLDFSNLAEGEWDLGFVVTDENKNVTENPWIESFLNEGESGDPVINEVTVDGETFNINFTQGDNDVVALLSAIEGPNGEELFIMVIEDTDNLPFNLNEEDLEDFDQIIEGTFEGSNISFDLNTDSLKEGTWEMEFVIFDNEESESDDFEYSFNLEKTALTEAQIANLNMSVFPNPAINSLNVTYSNISSNETISIVLTNSLGQKVAVENGSSSEGSINVTDLTSGLYFVSLVVDGIEVSKQKVMVK